MARGGSRPGAGRKPGSANKRTREIADRAAEEGLTPLEFLLNIMRTSADAAKAFEAAKAAAPYCHPRLSNIEANGNLSETYEERLKRLADGG
jgi:hypothetical protein